MLQSPNAARRRAPFGPLTSRAAASAFRIPLWVVAADESYARESSSSPSWEELFASRYVRYTGLGAE
jgi:hypothetical protein